MKNKIVLLLISKFFRINIEELMNILQTYKKENESLTNRIYSLKSLIKHLRKKLKAINDNNLVILNRSDELFRTLQDNERQNIENVENLKSQLVVSHRINESQILEIERLSSILNYQNEKNDFLTLTNKEIGKIKEELSLAQLNNNGLLSYKKQNIKLENDNAFLKTQIEKLNSKLKLVEEELIFEKTKITNSIAATKSSISKTVDGIIIEHDGLNIGNRANNKFQDNNNSTEFLGDFKFSVKTILPIDTIQYADVFYPKQHTPIRKWYLSNMSVTTGVAEPLLVKELKKVAEQIPGIKILQNISLCIHNRDYSYKPDLAIYWEEHNICLDIEVDEPYDIISRNPIHYKRSSDFLRNLYFISQGWIVIRFTEEQVVLNSKLCVNFIISTLYSTTNDNLLRVILDNSLPEMKPRWSYKEAIEMANQNYREKYLGIEIYEQNLKSQEITKTIFNDLAPDIDILPEEDYSHFEIEFNNLETKYIRITDFNEIYQYIFQDAIIKIELYQKGIEGLDVVTNGLIFIPFCGISKIEGLESPYKYPLYNRSSLIDNKFKELINEAIYGFHPIRIEYKDAKDNITFRNIRMIGYESDNRVYYCDRIWENYYKSKECSLILAYCELRNARRSFYIGRINAVQIINVKQIAKGHLIALYDSLKYPLINKDITLCHHIVNLYSSRLFKNNIIFECWYAIYLLLTDKTGDAMDIFIKNNGKYVIENITWENECLDNFKELFKIEEYKSRISLTLAKLGWQKDEEFLK